MSSRCVAILLAIAATAWVSARAETGAKKAPRELLREAIDLYVVGKYKEAADHLRPLVESRVLQDVADQKEALRTFGISLYLSGAKPAAERTFRALLLLDPSERLDPSFVRPEVVSFFESIRERYRWEIKEVVRKRTKRYTLANMLPPWGQFQNGHRKKGYWILGGELGLGVGSIVTASLLYTWRNKHNEFGDREGEAEVLQPMNWALFAATAAVIVYGIVDGLYYYYQRPKPAKAPKVGFLSPSRGGLGITF